MTEEAGSTRSVWQATAGELLREPLSADARVDVCVVGAGIAGMTTAYLLAVEGRSVVVLDDGPIGGGETGRTTAHLSDALDDRFLVLERLHGRTAARLAAASHRTAIDTIVRIIEQEAIACDLAIIDGFLFPGPDEGPSDLDAELEAAQRAGLAATLVAAPFSPFDSTAAIRFPRQGRFHPLKYLEALAARIEDRGGRIHTGTHVTAVHGGARVRVETERGATVDAGACIVATNSPITDYVVTHVKQAPYRTFAVALELPRGSVPDALYWDTADPYTYIRLQPDGARDLLIVGGADHKTGQKDDAEERLAGLERWARARFPNVGMLLHRWSGQVLEPNDHLAFIGRNPDGAENVYLVTGDSGQGMTHATLGALLLTDLVQGRANPWETLYDPKRITLRAAHEFLRENLNVAAQYAAWVMPGEVRSVDEVPRGAGRILRRGRRHIAVFRDEHGTVHERSAVCTHLKCIVDWNTLENSWDCPCHGSRFDPFGAVLNGPAAAPLEDAPSD